MAKSFKPNKAGYRQLMQEVGQAAIRPHVSQIASNANAQAQVEGAEYWSKVEPRGERTHNKVPYGIVHTANIEAMVDNADNNTLLKAMRG